MAAAVLSGVAAGPNSPGNPDDAVRHAPGSKQQGEGAAVAEVVAVTQKDRIVVPRAATAGAPEALVEAREANVPEPSAVDGQETRSENQRAPQAIPDTEPRETQGGTPDGAVGQKAETKINA